MNQLEFWLQDRIREKGPLSFREFMYWALYHPDWGYYTGDKLPFGKEGDFYTSPGVHAVFGETVARAIYQRWTELDRPSPFTIVEFGAGQGTLARDILYRIERMHPDLDSVLEYWIVEVSELLRNVQRQTLQDTKTRWAASLSDVGTFTGAVFSNELVDAFPVHIIRRTEHDDQLLYVSMENDRFTERWEPISDDRLLLEIERMAPFLTVGQQFEVNLHAIDWLTDIASYLQKGFVITIDYGDEIPYLLEGTRNGTIRAFHRHQVVSEVTAAPGEQDITADVNFTSLMEHGRAVGLETIFYGTQAKFLIESGMLESLAAVQPGADPFQDADLKRNLAIKHFILPGGMGERFKVLVQRKSGE